MIPPLSARQSPRPANRITQVRLLYVAHRQEILEQALFTFSQVFKDVNFGDLLTGRRQADRMEHLFCSIQMLIARRLPEALESIYTGDHIQAMKRVDTILVFARDRKRHNNCTVPFVYFWGRSSMSAMRVKGLSKWCDSCDIPCRWRCLRRISGVGEKIRTLKSICLF